MADRPGPIDLPKNFGVPRPIPQKYLPTQAKINRDYIHMAGSEQEFKRRRADARQVMITQAYRTIGPQAALQMTALVNAYPNMSAGALLGLTRGKPFIPKGQEDLPPEQRKVFAPVATPDPASSLARNDAEAAIADGSYNAPTPEAQPPRNLWEVVSGALNAPEGIKGIPGDINNVLKAAVSGTLAGLGWSLQASTNMPRQYFGQLDHALYLKDKYDLTDEEMADLYRGRPDILNSVAGPKTLPDDNLVYSIFNTAQDLIFDPERRGGEKYQGDPGKRLDAARAEIEAVDADLKDMLWNNTALGQWWTNVAKGVDPQWIPAREYAQVEQRMGGAPVQLPNGLIVFEPGKGGFDIRGDREKQEAQRLSLEYQQRRISRGLEVSTEKVLGFHAPYEWTIGRGFTWNVGDDPDSFGERLGSGVIDFAMSFVDPTVYIPVGKAVRAAGTLAAARRGGTVSEAVVAARKAAKNPEIVTRVIPDGVSDEVVAQFAGPGPVTSEALHASRLQAKADKALHDAATYVNSVQPQLVFNDRGVGSLVDQSGKVLIDSGVRRTVTGQGSALTFRSKGRTRTLQGQGDATVTLETRPVLAKDGTIDSYALFRTVQQADGSTKTTKARGSYATADEADRAAVDRYIADSQELSDVNAARRAEQTATQRLMESAKALRQHYRDSLALRTARLRVSGEKDGGWFVHDASENPYTNLRIARVEVDDTPVYTAGDYRVVQGRGRFAVRRGRSTEAVFDTVDEAQGYLRGKVDESLPEMVGDVPASKLARTDDGWQAASGHRVTKTSKGRYSVYEPRGEQMVRVGTFDSYSAAQAAVRRSYGKMRQAGQDALTLTEQPRRKMAYGILDGDELLSSHGQFRDAAKDLLGRARTRQQEDLAKLDGQIAAVRAEREGLRTGKAAVERERTAVEADMQRANPDLVESQFDEAFAVGDDIVTDPEQALLDRWWAGESDNLDDLVEAAALAQEKKAMSTFVTNEKMWTVLTETSAGQRLVDWMVNATSADAIIRRIPALKADHAAALARSTNADEVRMILSNLIGPQYDFRDLSRFGMLANARVKAVDAIANTDRLNNFYRLSQFAPHGHMVDGDNLDDVYWEVRRFAEGIGAKPQDIAPYLDNLIMNTRNRVERYELIYGQHGIIEGVLKSGLEAKGVGRSEVNEILSAFRGGTDIAQRRRLGVSKSSELLDLPAEQHVLDSVLKGTNPIPLTGKTQEEALLTHMLLSGKALVMPDYRNVRKAINMFAQAERYAKRNLTSDPNARAEFSRLLSDVSNATISTWRNAVLITGARAVRDLADLQVRFGGAGGPSILTHPFAFFSNAVSATVARESATRSRELMKSAPLLFVPTIAKRMRRSAPGFEEERYRNSFLIDARGLQNLLTDDLPSDMSGATKWQSRIQIEQGREAQQFATDKDFFADISRRGVIDPIVIVYDRAKDGYRISDGAKRAQAAYRMRLPAVPVKIVSGAIEDGQSFVKARTAKSDKWGRWANVNGNDGYYIGGVRQVVEQGRKAVRDSMIYSLGLRGLAPVADQEWARANGLGYFDDFNAVLLGQESDDILSDLSNQSTTFMGNFSMDQSLSTGRGSTLSMFGKDQPAQHANYAKTWADRAGELRALPHIGDLLNGRKSLDDVVEEIVGNPAARDEYLGMVNAGSLHSQKVADSDELLQILRAENDQLDQFIRGQYQMTLDAIADLAGRGNHVDLFDAIVAGKYGEKPLNRTNRALTSRIEALLQGDKSPNYVDQYLPDRLQGVDETLFDMSKSIVDRVFDAQGEVMDVFGMVGPQRQKYKEHVLDLARYLSDADRQKMARLIEGRGDDKFAREVLGVRSTNSVESMFDPDTIDRVAMRRATEDIKEVFYDAHKRRNWALALRAVSPFAQAAANTVYTWGKLMLRNPENAYRTYKPVQALMEPESDVISDILDFNLHEDDPYSIGKGFFAEDPVSGMRTFQYPIVNSIAGKILNGVTGGADTDFVFGANAQSLNPFQSGIAGGVSPQLTVPLGILDPQAALRDNMLGMFLRFQGASPSASDDPIEAAVEQFVPLKLMDLFTRGERKKSELIVSNYAAEVASGRWNVASPGDRERALSAATSKANWQMIAEGVIEIFAPTFGSLNTEVRIPIGGDFAADGSGKVVMRQAAGAMLYTEARDRLYDYIKNPDGTYKTGDELRMAKNAYFEDYGIGPLMAARAMIMDKETLPRSSEAYDLYTENTEWFNAHSDVIRYLFPGEQVYGPNLEASISRLATYYERKNGARYLSGKDMQEIVQKEFAETWAATAGQRAAARNGNVLSPYSDDAIRDEAAKFGGGWPIENPDQPKNVLRKIEDSLAELPEGDRDLIPGYEYIDSYLKERKRWDNPSASYSLYALGRRYVGEDKSGAFSTFWFRVAGDEFTETTKATSSWMD